MINDEPNEKPFDFQETKSIETFAVFLSHFDPRTTEQKVSIDSRQKKSLIFIAKSERIKR